MQLANIGNDLTSNNDCHYVHHIADIIIMIIMIVIVTIIVSRNDHYRYNVMNIIVLNQFALRSTTLNSKFSII